MKPKAHPAPSAMRPVRATAPATPRAPRPANSAASTAKPRHTASPAVLTTGRATGGAR